MTNDVGASPLHVHSERGALAGRRVLKMGSRMNRSRVWMAFTLTVTSSAACGGSPVSSLTRPPTFEPSNETKATVVKSNLRPLIIDWSGQDIALLEAQSKVGLAVVRYSPDKNQLELLTRCRAPGAYGY